MARITKGLYHHHAGAPLPEGFQVVVGAEPLLHHLDEVPDLVQKLNARPLVDIGEGVFQYRYLLKGKREGVTIWSLKFYRAVPCVTLTVPATGESA